MSDLRELREQVAAEVDPQAFETLEAITEWAKGHAGRYWTESQVGVVASQTFAARAHRREEALVRADNILNLLRGGRGPISDEDLSVYADG